MAQWKYMLNKNRQIEMKIRFELKKKKKTTVFLLSFFLFLHHYYHHLLLPPLLLSPVRFHCTVPQ